MVCSKAFKVLFRRSFYLPSAIATAVILFLLLAFLEQLLFVKPFAFFIPASEILAFVLITAISVLSGLTVPLAIYKILSYKFNVTNMKEFLAVAIGVVAGCGCSFAFSLIAVTGYVGSAAVGFLNAYQTYIRLAVIAMLSYSFYTEIGSLSKIYCK